jgi:hypothetical protein
MGLCISYILCRAASQGTFCFALSSGVYHFPWFSTVFAVIQAIGQWVLIWPFKGIYRPHSAHYITQGVEFERAIRKQSLYVLN